MSILVLVCFVSISMLSVGWQENYRACETRLSVVMFLHLFPPVLTTCCENYSGIAFVLYKLEKAKMFLLYKSPGEWCN